MAVTFDAKNTTVAAATDVTASISGLTVGSGANRALIGFLGLSPGSTAVTMVWDPTGANQPLTLIGSDVSSDNLAKIYMFGLVAPASGNKILKADWTTTSGFFLDAISFAGVDQTGGATSFPHFASATGTSTSPAVTITTTANDFVAGATSNGLDCVSAMDHTTINTACNSFGYGGNYSAGSAGTVTLGGTLFSSRPWIMLGCDIAELAADVLGAQIWL